MKTIVLGILLLSAPLFALPPSPKPSPSPSAGLPKPQKCTAEVTCGNGDKMSCTGEGPHCDCKSGTNDDGYKTVTCDDEPFDYNSPNTQTCSSK